MTGWINCQKHCLLFGERWRLGVVRLIQGEGMRDNCESHMSETFGHFRKLCQ